MLVWLLVQYRKVKCPVKLGLGIPDSDARLVWLRIKIQVTSL